MGRPPRHDAESLLDAAATLAAEGGPRTVTMTAVAKAAGAPSGSVYHRFPSRPALLAALWLRSLDRFQAGFLDAVKVDDPLTAAVEGARHVVAWSRANRVDASILLWGARDFAESEWPAASRTHLERANRKVIRVLRDVGARLGLTSAEDRELVQLAVIALPYSLVRTHYRAGERIPAYAERLAAESVTKLLSIEQSHA